MKTKSKILAAVRLLALTTRDWTLNRAILGLLLLIGSFAKRLERAHAQHDGTLVHIKFDPLLAAIRGDARYVAMLTKMGLPLQPVH